MILNLGVGFSDLVDNGGQKYVNMAVPQHLLLKTLPRRYSLHLVDTIRVESNKSSLLTEGTKSSKDTLFFLTPESEDEKPKKSARQPPVLPRSNGSPPKKTVGGKVLRNQTRRAVQDEVHMTAAAKLAEHQRELREKLQADGLLKYSEDGGGTGGKEGKGWKKFQSYKGEGGLPAEVEKLRVGPKARFNIAVTYIGVKIFVDRKAQTVILPMHGSAVPFHINTIKNASKNDEGEFTILRINFQTPGQLAGKKEDTVSQFNTPFMSLLTIAIAAVPRPRCYFHSLGLLSLAGWPSFR